MSKTKKQEPQLDEKQPGLKSAAAIKSVEGQLDRMAELLAAEQAEVAQAQVPCQHPVSRESSAEIELSIVIPCLDEADTLGTCVEKALKSIERLGISGEVVVADNGSQDDSVAIAQALGARVVHVAQPGYGAALMGGIEAARGRFVIMGDADDSYDFSQSHRFYERLRAGADLVQGCRLPAGGGRVMPGAMPWLHQLGNPALTWLVQQMFGAQINDVYCGMRGFTKELYERLNQRCTGMEFATEMIIKSTLFRAQIEEVPITLHPDGRQSHRPHLRTFRDGWRTLRFFLMLSPRWTFLLPGLLLACLGLLGCVLVLGKLSVAGVVFDAHTLLVSVLCLLVASQVASFAVFAKSFAASEGILPQDPRIESFAKVFSLERTLWISCGFIIAGTAGIAWQSWNWAAGGFGPLDYSSTMRWIIPSAAAIALGVQWAFSGFMLSILRMARR
ncbi:MAG: glycosyltransferase family 2 protein [bacterium]|nr:glycosyltransferase family 2 protein [bacterium]